MRLAVVAPLTNRFWALSIGLALLLVDLITKFLVHAHLPLTETGIPIFLQFLGIDFYISHAINQGAAWGIFSNYQLPLVGLRIALVGGLFAYFWTSERHPFWRLPLALVIAGATGNIIDTFFYGHVVDMFHFIFWGYDYPVFNVADSSIFVGIAALAISSWFE